MSEPEEYEARVRLFCNDQTRNFHRKHGKTWLADFGLRHPEAPKGHWMRWESIGHAKRRSYDLETWDGDGMLDVLLGHEADAIAGVTDEVPSLENTTLEDFNAYEDFWEELAEIHGRFVPADIVIMSNPKTRTPAYIDHVGEYPKSDLSKMVSFVRGAEWLHDEVRVPRCACGHSIEPIRPTEHMVRVLDQLAQADMTALSLKGLKQALRATLN